MSGPLGSGGVKSALGERILRPGAALLALFLVASIVLVALATSTSARQELSTRPDINIDVIDQLMAQCLSLDEATALIGGAARANGLANWSVRTDGPFSYPVGQRDVVVDHVRGGCYVYSGAGFDGQGVPVFYLAGPETI